MTYKINHKAHVITFSSSTDCLNWLLMPKATKCAVFLTPLAVSSFQGDSSLVANVYAANPPYPPNTDVKDYHDVIKKNDLIQCVILKPFTNSLYLFFESSVEI